MIRANFILQIAGKPKELVNETLGKLHQELEKNFKEGLIEAEIVEAEDQEKDTGLYSGFVEAKIEFEDIEKLYLFVFDYMPISVDIEHPSTIKQTANEFATGLNEASRRLVGFLSMVRELKHKVAVLEREVLKKKK